MTIPSLHAGSDEPKIRRMGRKKKTSGEHTTPRQPVQFPADWIKLARRLAAKRKQPTMWFILSLIAEAAQAEGETELPPAPWEENG